jgi:hypothetical protein
VLLHPIIKYDIEGCLELRSENENGDTFSVEVEVEGVEYSTPPRKFLFSVGVPLIDPPNLALKISLKLLSGKNSNSRNSFNETFRFDPEADTFGVVTFNFLARHSVTRTGVSSLETEASSSSSISEDGMYSLCFWLWVGVSGILSMFEEHRENRARFGKEEGGGVSSALSTFKSDCSRISEASNLRFLEGGVAWRLWVRFRRCWVLAGSMSTEQQSFIFRLFAEL